MKRRSFLSIFGLGAASAAGEAVAGPAWLFSGHPPPTPDGLVGAGSGLSPAVTPPKWAKYSELEIDGAMRRELEDRILRAHAALERARDYLVSDIGGAF